MRTGNVRIIIPQSSGCRETSEQAFKYELIVQITLHALHIQRVIEFNLPSSAGKLEPINLNGSKNVPGSFELIHTTLSR